MIINESRSPDEKRETGYLVKKIVFYRSLLTAILFLNDHRYLIEEHVTDCMLSEFVEKVLRIKEHYEKSHTK